jgi:hypothetical protein
MFEYGVVVSAKDQQVLADFMRSDSTNGWLHFSSSLKDIVTDVLGMEWEEHHYVAISVTTGGGESERVSPCAAQVHQQPGVFLRKTGRPSRTIGVPNRICKLGVIPSRISSTTKYLYADGEKKQRTLMVWEIALLLV